MIKKLLLLGMAAAAISVTNVTTNVVAGPTNSGTVVKAVTENVPWSNNTGIIKTTAGGGLVVGSTTPAANVVLTVVGGMSVDSITVTGVLVSTVPTTYSSTQTFNAPVVFNSSALINGRLGIAPSFAVAPAIFNLSQTNTGIYFQSDEIGFTIGGSTYTKVNASGLVQTNGNLVGVDFIAGGTTPTGVYQAGSLRINSTSTGKGSVLWTVADNAGNTTTSEAWASQGGARTYTRPDFGASGNYALSTSTGPKYLLQTPVQCSVTASSSTAATTYVNTNLTCAITPTQTTSLIRISVSGDLASNSGTPGNTVAITIARGGSNIFGTSGFAISESQGAGVAVGMFPAALSGYYDAPATTSLTTYALQIKVLSGTTTATWCQTNQTCRITLEEIGQ